MSRRGRGAAVARACMLLVLAASLLSAGYWLGVRGRGPASVVSRCPDCEETSAVLLRELVTREISLRDAGLTQWDVVTRLREWAYANTDAGVAPTPAMFDRDRSFDFYRRSAPDLFAAFLQDRGGVLCGGVAQALAQLYRLFGFQASTIDSGDPAVWTHVVTVVKIHHEGRPLLVVQDAYLNLSYVTDGGQPYDYFDLLATLARREHRAVRILPGRTADRDALVHPSADTAYFDYIVDFTAPPTRVLPGGVQKFKSRLSLDTVEQKFGAAIRSFLEREGYPPDTLYVFLYPVGGSDGSIVRTAQERVKHARRPPAHAGRGR